MSVTSQVPAEPVRDGDTARRADFGTSRERLELLLDLNNAIVSNLEFRELLRAISASVRRVMKCDAVGVALPDPNDQRLRIHAVDFPEAKGLIHEENRVPGGNAPTQRAYQDGTVIALDARALAALDGSQLAVAEGLSSSLRCSSREPESAAGRAVPRQAA